MHIVLTMEWRMYRQTQNGILASLSKPNRREDEKGVIISNSITN
jgi:hypothetical protein